MKLLLIHKPEYPYSYVLTFNAAARGGRRRAQRALARRAAAHARRVGAPGSPVGSARCPVIVQHALRGWWPCSLGWARLLRYRPTARTIISSTITQKLQAMVQLVDRFIVLDHGALLAAGSPEEIVKNPEVIEAYLGNDDE